MMKDDFLRILHDDRVFQFLNTGLNELYNEKFSFCTYFGVNYTNQKLLNIKFYIVSFEKKEINSISTFFPFAKEIESVYNQYEQSNIIDVNHTGTGFTLKIAIDQITYSYYNRLKGHQIPPIQKLNLPKVEVPLFENTYCAEFKEGKQYFKNYYLIRDKDNINTLLNDFGLQDLKTVRYAEYAEFDEKQKMVMFFDNQSGEQEKYIQNNSTPEFIELHNFILKTFKNVTPAYPGVYKNSEEKSMYYLHMNQKETILKDSMLLFDVLNYLKTNR